MPLNPVLKLLLEDYVKFCLHTSENVKILGRIENRDSKLIKQSEKKSLKTLITVSYTEKYGAGEQIFIELQNKVEQNQAIECRN